MFKTTQIDENTKQHDFNMQISVEFAMHDDDDNADILNVYIDDMISAFVIYHDMNDDTYNVECTSISQKTKCNTYDDCIHEIYATIVCEYMMQHR